MSEASLAHAHARSRRRGLAALAAAGTAGLMSLAGCGIQSTSVRVVGAAPTLQTADAGTFPSAGNGTNGYQLYFFRDGRLSPVTRYTNQTVSDAFVLQSLIQGPNSADQNDGFSSSIPQALTVISNQALDQKWAYQYSQSLTENELAEIVCSVQADVDAPSVGTLIKGYGLVWHNCSDFTDEGAPAALPSAGDGAAGIGVSGEPSQ